MVQVGPGTSHDRPPGGWFTPRSGAQSAIANALHGSVNAVCTHQRSVYRKLGVRSRRDAIRVQLRTGGVLPGQLGGSALVEDPLEHHAHEQPATESCDNPDEQRCEHPSHASDPEAVREQRGDP